MKKVFLFILFTTAIVGVTDIALGHIINSYVRTHQLPGRYQQYDKLIRQVESDILFIGNSAIQNGIDPFVIEDSLQLSCYNGGIMGQGPDFFETMVDCALQRYTPKIIVLGFRPEEMGEGVGDGIYDILRPYYHIGFPSIDNHINNVSKSEQILLNSSLYRYNGIWVRILLNGLYNKEQYSEKGGLMNETPAVLPTLKDITSVDVPVQRKTDCIKHIIQKCKSNGVKVLVCFPPTLQHFTHTPLPCIEAVKQICEENGIMCYIDYDNPDYQKSTELFYDNNHLNKNGARIYSSLMASRIKKELNN